MASKKTRLPKPFSHEDLIRRQLLASCFNCERFDHANEVCLQFDARPPAKVLVFGCPEWEGEIPF